MQFNFSWQILFQALKVRHNYFGNNSVWKTVFEVTETGQVHSEQLLMSLKLNNVVPTYLSEDTIDQCLSLACECDDQISTLTFQQYLYCLELLSDRLDMSRVALWDADMSFVHDLNHQLHTLLHLLGCSFLKHRLLTCYNETKETHELSSSTPSSPLSPAPAVVICLMQVLRQAGIFSVAQQNITLQFQCSYHALGHVFRLQQMRFQHPKEIHESWISLWKALQVDLAACMEQDLISSVKYSHPHHIFTLLEYTPGICFAAPARSSSSSGSLILPFAKLSTAQSLDRFWKRVWELVTGILSNVERLQGQGGKFSCPFLQPFSVHQAQHYSAILASELQNLLVHGHVLREYDNAEEIFESAILTVTQLRREEEPLLSPLHVIETICTIFQQIRQQQQQMNKKDPKDKEQEDSASAQEDEDLAVMDALFQLRESTDAAVQEQVLREENEERPYNNAYNTITGNAEEVNDDVDSIEELSSVDGRRHSPRSIPSHTNSQPVIPNSDTQEVAAQHSSRKKQLTLLAVDESDDTIDKGQLSLALSAAIQAPTPPAHKHHTRFRFQFDPSQSQNANPVLIQTISEIVRLLMHFPSLGFDPTPWQIYHIYVEIVSEEMERIHNNNKGGEETEVNIHETSNAIVMKMLKKLAERFALSPAVFSTFFSPYYAPAETYAQILPKQTPSIASILKAPFFDWFASENAQRLLFLNADLLKWEYARCISCFRNSKEPFTQSLFYAMLNTAVVESAQDRYHANMLLSFQHVSFWIGQYIKDPALATAGQAIEPPFFADYVATSALSGLPISMQDLNEQNIFISVQKLPRLTFSTFIIFAVRCFTKHLFFNSNYENTSNVTVTEKQFLDEIRRMLRMFSANLTHVQRVMEIHILDFLFDQSKISATSSSPSSDEDEDNSDSEDDGSSSTSVSDVLTKDSSAISQQQLNNKKQQRKKSTNKRRLLQQFMARTVLFSHRCYDQRLQSLPSAQASTSGMIALPPRPPVFLWDAARFVDFIRYFHLMEYPTLLPAISADTGAVLNKLFQSSLTHAWTVYGVYLYQDMEAVPDVQQQLQQSFLQEGHVPPLPMDIDDEKIMQLIHLQAVILNLNRSNNAMSVVEELKTRDFRRVMICDGLFTIACSVAEHKAHPSNEASASGTATTTSSGSAGIPLEDLLRLGGSALMHKLSELQGFLQLSFYCLARSASAFLGQASNTLGEPSVIVLKNIPSDADAVEDIYDKYGGATLEIPIHVACDFFACRELIGAAKVAFLARESLHHRLRPPFSLITNNSSTGTSGSSAAGANEQQSYRSVVTMNFAEFEELFVRSAFQICVQHAQRQQQSASSSSTTATSQQAYEIYQREEKKVLEFKSKAPKYIWGRNFLSPYAAILQQYFQFPVLYIEDFQRLRGFVIPSIAQSAQTLRHYCKVVAEVTAAANNNLSPDSSQLADSSKTRTGPDKGHTQPLSQPSPISSPVTIGKSVIESIANHNFSHLIADPVTRHSHPNPNSVQQQQQLLQAQTQNNKKRLHFADETGAPLAKYQSPTSSRVKAFFGSGQGVASAGYDPTNPPDWIDTHSFDAATTGVASTGQAHLSSSSTPSSLQYIPLHVNAKQTFIHDIKESLWPVFATYCSCGDSSDPGRLSSPNLFTLLSKLNLLDDGTLLSDIGRIFYRIGTKSFTRDAQTWSFRQFAKIQRKLYQKQLKQQGDASQLRDSNAPSVRRRFQKHPSTAPLSSSTAYQQTTVRWIQQQSLIFEEFLLFLYAFAQLRYEGRYDLLQDEDSRFTLYHPSHASLRHADSKNDHEGEDTGIKKSEEEERDAELLQALYATLPKKWHFWYDKMTASVAFQRLFYEHVQPLLTSQATLLAFPEDARYRDHFAVVFACDVLEIIERVEGPLSTLFHQEVDGVQGASIPKGGGSTGHPLTVLVKALRRLELLPQVITEQQVLQLVRDVLPDELYSLLIQSGSSNNNGGNAVSTVNRMVFPQWMWILCLAALQAVRQTIASSSSSSNDEEVCFPYLVLCFSLLELGPNVVSFLTCYYSAYRTWWVEW